MKRILRAIGAAALGFSAFLPAASTPSAASTYTINFTGTATGVSGAFATFHAAVGDPISGSLTFNPFTTTPSNPPDPTVTNFNEVGTYSFHISNSTLGLSLLGGGAGFVSNKVNPPQNLLQLGAGDSTEELALFFVTDGGGTALTSLAPLPTTPDGILALLGGGSKSASGFIRAGVGSEVSFSISLAAPATTPIPATLPLFASGLVGLGLVARRRKRLARA